LNTKYNAQRDSFIFDDEKENFGESKNHCCIVISEVE